MAMGVWQSNHLGQRTFWTWVVWENRQNSTSSTLEAHPKPLLWKVIWFSLTRFLQCESLTPKRWPGCVGVPTAVTELTRDVLIPNPVCMRGSSFPVCDEVTINIRGNKAKHEWVKQPWKSKRRATRPEELQKKTASPHFKAPGIDSNDFSYYFVAFIVKMIAPLESIDWKINE